MLDFIARAIYNKRTGKKRGENMSPKGRPPVDNPKNIRLEIRLTKDEAELLKYCADELNVNRTDVINKGIKLVESEIKKNK